MQRLALVSLCILAIAAPSFSSAQAPLNQLSNTSVSITLDPASPEPFEEVTATLDNFVSSLYGSKITWYLDGTDITTPGDQTKTTFTTGTLGDEMNLSAQITLPNGQTQTIRRTIAPVYVDIIVEPQTHVPDFYQGRSLPTPGSTVNLTALINGITTTSNDLIYTWRVNQKILGNGGQRGQYKASFAMPLDSRVVVSLEVSRLSGEVVAKKSFSLLNNRPFVRFYEVNTLYGLLPKVVDDLHLIGNTATVRAEPYYIDSRVYNNPDVRAWKVNNTEVRGGSNPYELTLQRPGITGSSRVDFRIQSMTQAIQGTTADLMLTY